MAAELVSDALWSLIGHFSQPQRRSRKVADHVYLTELASQVFCSYSEVEFRGGCCQSSWVAVLA
jgi:hypothetical protein